MFRLRFLALVVVVLMLTGCIAPLGAQITASGPVVAKEFDLARFTQVAAGSAFAVEITGGDTYSVTVMVNENLLDQLDVSVSGSTLRIYLKPGLGITGKATMQAKVTMPGLAGLDLSGATRTTVAGFNSEQPLDIKVSGASTLRGDMTSGDARVDASGASTVALQGGAQDMNVKASGASTVDFGRFSSQDTTVDASGASRVTVSPSGQLDVEASGASTVLYVGEPAGQRVNTSGASTVRQK
jgi:hypothetical protein